MLRFPNKRIADLALLAVFVLGGTSLAYEIRCCVAEHDEDKCCAGLECEEHCCTVLFTVRLFTAGMQRRVDEACMELSPIGSCEIGDVAHGGSPPDRLADGLVAGVGRASPDMFILHSSLLI